MSLDTWFFCYNIDIDLKLTLNDIILCIGGFYNMHIPENYLSPSTCAVMTVAMAPVWYKASKHVKENLDSDKLPMIGVGAAFSFVAMMFNIPIVGGSSGHAIGGTLLAILLGPDAACIAISVALLIQAILFGDGGILAFGANCFNMAFILPFVGYYLYKLFVGGKEKKSRKLISAFIASYVAINIAALAAAIEFGIQPILFNDASGNALYCPYSLSVSIPAMMVEHLLLFGFVEAIFTTGVLGYLYQTKPNLVDTNTKTNNPVYLLLGVLIALVPLGLIAQGTAWGEWSNEELIEQIGYVPSGMQNGFSFESIMPDYSLNGLPEVFTYYLSAIIGVAILIVLFKMISTMKKKHA